MKWTGAALAACGLGVMAGCGSSALQPTTPRPVKPRAHRAPGGQQTFSAPGMVVSFRFPGTFRLKLARSRRVAGNTARASQAAVGIGRYDLLIVSRFPKRPIPVTANNIKRLRPLFDSAVSAALGRKIASTVASIDGLPALLYPPAPVAGLPVKATSRITDVFVADDEYELNCQYTPAGAVTVQAACREMLATLSVSRP